MHALCHEEAELVVALIVEQIATNVVVEGQPLQQLNLALKVGSA